MLEAIAFDVDQTLWDFHSLRRAALTACLDLIGQRSQNVATEHWSIDDLQARYDAIEATAPGERLALIRRESLNQAASEASPDDTTLGDDLTDLYFSIRHGPAEPFPDVVPGLVALRNLGLRLAVVTNGNSDLEALGVADLFDTFVIGPDIGMAKPEPRIYAEVETRLGVDGAALACVGDDPEKDVEGPQARGWRGVWNDRDVGPLPSHIIPDATVTTLTELVPVVEGWLAQPY